MNRPSKLGRKPLRFVTLDLSYDNPNYEIFQVLVYLPFCFLVVPSLGEPAEDLRPSEALMFVEF